MNENSQSNIVPFYEQEIEAGSTWWKKGQTSRGYLDPYYVIVSESKYWITIRLKHFQRTDPPSGMNPKYFRDEYDPRPRTLPSIHDGA